MSVSGVQPKKRLLIVGYYRLEDGFRACANYLEKDYIVLFFPLLYYENQNIDASEDLIRYMKGQPLLHESENYKMIPNDQPIDVIFLWYFNYFTKSWAKFDEFMSVKKALGDQVNLIAYSWDPMIVKSEMNLIRVQLLKQCHAYLTGDSQEIKYLKHYGIKHASYAPSGFDCKLTQPMELVDADIDYVCDVSIVCTNFYDHVGSFPEEFVRFNRRKLIDLIYENRKEIKFHIYGPEFLKEIYPDAYRGYVRYVDCSKVFSHSKINLCIHAVSYVSQGSELYFSERLPQILGSRGLLYCETEYNYLLNPKINYILADVNDPITQIRSILSHYDDYQRYRSQGYELALKSLTWDQMCRKLKVITDTFFTNIEQSKRNRIDKGRRRAQLNHFNQHKKRRKNKIVKAVKLNPSVEAPIISQGNKTLIHAYPNRIWAI